MSLDKVKRDSFKEYRIPTFIKYSPDGSRVLFGLSEGEKSSLWLLDAASGEHHIIIQDVGSGMWLDNGRIAYQDGKKMMVYSIEGKSSEEMFTVEKGGVIGPMADGRWLVSVSENIKAEIKASKGGDYDVFDEWPFWKNGAGVVNGMRRGLFIIDPENGSKERLSPPEMNVTQFCLSACGRRVAFVGQTYTDVMPLGAELHLWESGKLTEVMPPHERRGLSWPVLTDDALYFYANENLDGHTNPRLFRYDEKGITPMPWEDIEPYDVHPVGNDLYIMHCDHCDLVLTRFREGVSTQVGRGRGIIIDYDIRGNRAVILAMLDNNQEEIYFLDLDTGAITRATFFCKAFMDSHAVGVPESFTFVTRHGTELDGWVIPPTEKKPGKMPGVLMIHGGPKGAFTAEYDHEMQVLAAEGYYVFFTNPRGSTGKGSDFADITGKTGTIDYDDLMDFTDEVIKRYPVDPDRLGAAGVSFGGYMCNWIAGHTDRFKALVSQCGISNYVSKFLTTDIGPHYDRLQVGAWIWDDLEKVWETSPLKYAPNVKTPVLFLHADQDYRCWMAEALQMFTALKLFGVETRLCLFHGEEHGVGSRGSDENRVAFLDEMLAWLDGHLK